MSVGIDHTAHILYLCPLPATLIYVQRDKETPAYSIYTCSQEYFKLPEMLNSIKLVDTTIQRIVTSKYICIMLDDKCTWQVCI